MARTSVKLLCLIACIPVTFFLTCPVSATELYIPALKAKSESIDIPIMIDRVVNLIAIPSEVVYQPDLKDSLPVPGNSSEIEKVIVHDDHDSKFITLIPGGASNPSFTLQGGEGLIVYAKQDKEITFTSVPYP